MATIHHGIVKKAAAQGVILTLEDDDTVVQALHAQNNVRVRLDTEGLEDDDKTGLNSLAGDALVAALDIVAFNTDEMSAGWKIEQTDEGGFVLIDAEGAIFADGEDGEFETVADAVIAFNERETEEDEGANEEDDAPHSVVPEHYKAEYKAIGVNGQDNGDFLARAFSDYCRVGDKIDVFRVERLLSRNGIEREPIPGNRGWEGRYRMTARNMLARRISDDGTLYVPANLTGTTGEGKDAKPVGELEIAVPANFRERWATKPKKSRKKDKAEAPAETAPEAKPKRTRKPKAEQPAA